MRPRVSFLKHPLQVKYLLIVLLAILLPTLLVGYCLYHVVFTLLANQMAFPEAIASNLTPVVERMNRILIISLPILVLTLAWLGLVVSHRFAGPIERMETDLDKILSGDLRHRMRVRKNDDLAGIAEKINQLVAKIK